MAGHWRMLLGLGFSDYSWVECDVDKGWPTIERNVPELTNLLMVGYFRALYAPLGVSRILRDKASLTSMKLHFSMLRDKPPWVVREYRGRKPPRHRQNFVFQCLAINPFVCPSILALLIILPEATGHFSSFLVSAATILFSNSPETTFSQLFHLAFLFPPVPVLYVFAFSFSSHSLSLTQFSARMGNVIVLGSVFSSDGLCNCFRLRF